MDNLLNSTFNKIRDDVLEFIIFGERKGLGLRATAQAIFL